MAGMHRLAPPLSLNQEQEQEYRLGGNQIHHDFEHPVAKFAKGNVRERAVFRLWTETLFRSSVLYLKRLAKLAKANTYRYPIMFTELVAEALFGLGAVEIYYCDGGVGDARSSCFCFCV